MVTVNANKRPTKIGYQASHDVKPNIWRCNPNRKSSGVNVSMSESISPDPVVIDLDCCTDMASTLYYTFNDDKVIGMYNKYGF